MFFLVIQPQILILAGTDRLDKPLTIGQMQGKFQLALLPQVGAKGRSFCDHFQIDVGIHIAALPREINPTSVVRAVRARNSRGCASTGCRDNFWLFEALSGWGGRTCIP